MGYGSKSVPVMNESTLPVVSREVLTHHRARLEPKLTEDERQRHTTYAIQGSLDRWFIPWKRLYSDLCRRYGGFVEDSLDNWFKREVLIHEASLLRYLGRVWFRQEEIHDLRQEVYVRVYEAARKARPTTPRAFLFATARHLVTDRIRRGRIVSIEAVGDPEALNVLIDEVSPERKASAWQELKRVGRALNALPPRCREVVWLRKVDELSTKEVAEQLGVSVRTVEGQILKGMRILSDAVFEDDASPRRTQVSSSDDREAEHGD